MVCDWRECVMSGHFIWCDMHSFMPVGFSHVVIYEWLFTWILVLLLLLLVCVCRVRVRVRVCVLYAFVLYTLKPVRVWRSKYPLLLLLLCQLRVTVGESGFCYCVRVTSFKCINSIMCINSTVFENAFVCWGKLEAYRTTCLNDREQH